MGTLEKFEQGKEKHRDWFFSAPAAELEGIIVKTMPGWTGMLHLSDGAKDCINAEQSSETLSGTAARHEGRQTYLAPGTIVVATQHLSTHHRSKDTGDHTQQHNDNTANHNTSCLASRQGTAGTVSIVVAVVIVVGLQQTTARGARIAHSSINALWFSSISSQD